MQNMPEDTYQALPCFEKGAKRVLILTADKTEDLEFFYPYYRFIEEGFDVDIATPEGGAFKGKNGLGLHTSIKIDALSVDNYDVLYIPGGQAPEQLQRDERVLDFVRSFARSGKPVISICHGPQVLAAADVIEGRRIAAWPEVRGEIEDAGGVYVNEKAVGDGQFMTGRWPADLPALMGLSMKVLQNSELEKTRTAA